MPIYEYKCPKCAKQFEELIFGDEIPPCPKCGEKTTERLMSCATIRTPAPSRAGQTVSFPSAGSCNGCSGGDCSSC